jgi:hypothetical protein
MPIWREVGRNSAVRHPDIEMAETRPVPPQGTPEATPEREGSSPAVPLDSPEQALAILERATIEMANRTLPSQLAEPVSPSADADAPTASPSEPREPPIEAQAIEQHKPAAEDVPAGIMKLAEEMKPAQDMAQEFAQVIKPVETFDPIEPIKPAAQFELVAQYDPMTIVSPAAPAVPAQPKNTPPAFRPMFDDHFRLALSSRQSLVFAVAIFALVIGAFGMAAYGWVAAHDWSCRLELVNYCPPSAIPKPLAPPEIPS